MNILDKQAKQMIVEAIRSAEKETSGEIRVRVKARCGQDPMKEAQKVFRRLGMHRTRERNAVLIFVAFKSRCFAIFGDEKIHEKVGGQFWNATRDTMNSFFLKGDILGGITAGVRSAGERLKTHYPRKSDDKNELSNTVSEG